MKMFKLPASQGRQVLTGGAGPSAAYRSFLPFPGVALIPTGLFEYGVPILLLQGCPSLWLRQGATGSRTHSL